MFKDLRTSTKLILLCAMFMISVAVTTYNLVAEKQLAIAFARKELAGSKFLGALRPVYVAVLANRPFNPSALELEAPAYNALKTLSKTQSGAISTLQMGPLVEALSNQLVHPGSIPDPANATELLAKMQQLAARAGDSSNLTLDPELDTYYVQDIIADRLPKLLGRLGDLQIVPVQSFADAAPANEHKARFLVIDGLIKSTIEEIDSDLKAAYRGSADETLRQAVDASYSALFSAVDAYLVDRRLSIFEASAIRANNPDLKQSWEAVLDSSSQAWIVSQAQLDRLLQLRVDRLIRRMNLSLITTGALVVMSIIIAVMTYRQIVEPLRRFEKVASMVSKTGNYDVRVDYASSNEIGRVAVAFDSMLGELAAARDRERSEQSELAKVARLTTMGVMTASIAHEIAQPLTAIVSSGNASLRWLSHATPDLAEVRKLLNNIVESGHRASRIIYGVRAMFKKEEHEKDWMDVNQLVDDVLVLIQSRIQKEAISVRTELGPDIPAVLAGRIQLQEVLMNLIANAIEAMSAVTDGQKLLVIGTKVGNAASVVISIADTGPGIDPQNLDRIFEPFFTTKSDAMGMGLSICRSIIEGYGGQLWASPVETRGSVFYISLPAAEAAKGEPRA
jgi:signal transduction histidine kinase